MDSMEFNVALYNTTNCSGGPMLNVVNSVWPWIPNKCMYNKTMSCANGQPMVKFYNNSGILNL